MIIRDSKYLRFMRWFNRLGFFHEETGWRAFNYGYRLGYLAARKRAQGKKGSGT